MNIAIHVTAALALFGIVGRTLRRQRFHTFTAYEQTWLAYVDLDAILPDHDRSLQFDDCHFTSEGRERVAAAFFDFIVAHELVGPLPDGGPPHER